MDEQRGTNLDNQQPLQKTYWRRTPKLLLITACLISLAAGAILVRAWSLGRNQPPIVSNHSVVDIFDTRIRGQLHFGSVQARERREKITFEGTDLGQDGDPRRYIFGHPQSPQRAIWHFDALPDSARTLRADEVRCLITCSLFRLVKSRPDGPEASLARAEVAEISIRVVSHACPQLPPVTKDNFSGLWQWGDLDRWTKYQRVSAEYLAQGIDMQTATPNTEAWKAINRLAEQYGYYEIRNIRIPNLIETSVLIPAGVLNSALNNKPEVDETGNRARPLLSVYVKCDTEDVMFGVASSDLCLDIEPLPRR